MSALGDIIYILGILIPFLALFIKNYFAYLLGFVMGTIGFLIFVQNYTDITFSASDFYLAIIPLFVGLIDFAMFFNWLKEEYI